MTIPGPSIGTAGEDLVLTCGVRVVDHLIAQSIVNVEWSGGSLSSGNGVMEYNIQNIDGSYISNTSLFNPLLPSHGGIYTCQAEINISAVNLLKMARNNTNVIVQSKQACMNFMCIYNLKPTNTMYFFTLQFPSLM